MFLIQQPPHLCDSKQQQQQQPTGEKPPLRSSMSGLALPASSDPSLPQDGGEDLGTKRRAEERRGEERTRVTQSKWSVLWLSLVYRLLCGPTTDTNGMLQ